MKLLLLAFSIVFASVMAQAQTSDEYYKMAMQKIGSKQYLDANTLIEKAIEQDKANYQNYILKSLIDFQLNNHQEALYYAFVAIEFAPDKSQPYNLAGQLYNSYGYPDSAIAMYNRAISRAETDSVKYGTYINRSWAYRNKRDFKAARKDLELVLKADPANHGALNNLAIIYAYQKRTEKAIIYLEKLASVDSTTLYTFINLGLYYTETGNYAAAMANFDHALTLSANTDPLFYSNRGHLYYKMGEYTMAIKDLNRSIQEYPTNSYAYRNRALVYMAMNKKDEACRDLEAALYNGFSKLYGDEVKKLAKKNCK